MSLLARAPLRALLFPALLACAFAAPALSATPPAATPTVVPSPSHEVFEASVRQAITPEIAASLTAFKVLHLSGDVGPWFDTGLALARDQPVTLLMNGRVWWSRALQLSLEPSMAVWAQVGQRGTIFRGLRNTHGFRAERAGPLRLKLFPGLRWTAPDGRYDGEPAPINPDAGGGVSVAVLAWKPGTDVPAALQRLALLPALAPWAQAEAERLAQPTVAAPDGWRYLWELGPAEIFTRRPDGGDGRGATLAVHTRGDVGILQKDVSFALRPGSTLSWDWKIDALPSAVAENQVPTHDYLSIAVEFDNGRDLTFLWSHSLPEGTHFDCPLPAWQHRETHVVARSGSAGLGRWQAEKIDLVAAYRRAIGGPLPQRVTRVWLIANSVFQKGEGRGEFARIELADGARRLRVD